MQSTGSLIGNFWNKWTKRRNISGNPQRITSKNCYILPSKLGFLFALVVGTFFICATNYQVNAVFLYCFILILVGLASAWQGHKNLTGLTIHCLSIEDTFAGEAIKVELLISTEREIRYALHLHFVNAKTIVLAHLPLEGKVVTLYMPSTLRGHYQLPKLTLFSFFPFGLYRVWSYAFFDETYYVYPHSFSPGYLPTPLLDEGNTTLTAPGDEELYNLKKVEDPWVQASHIAWKIAARGQGWYLKNMQSPAGLSWIFRMQDVQSSDIEQKLQILCYWICTAEQQTQLYGLEIMDIKTGLSKGSQHLTRCLRLLADYR